MKRVLQTTSTILAAIVCFCALFALAEFLAPHVNTSGRKYMETIKFNDKGNVKMIAHRGLSGLEMENTVPAFEAAGALSYYGIESDVHVTKDNKFVIVHDDDLNRVADVDKIVEESTFAELRAVRLKNMDGEIDENLYLPSLTEYLEICKKHDKQAILELKNAMTAEQVWAIAEEVKTVGMIEKTTFISFASENLISLRERYQTADAQYLTEECSEEEIEFMIKNNLDADLSWRCVTKEKVDKLHKAGLKVNTWTVNSVSVAALMKECGVDMITTNILE